MHYHEAATQSAPRAIDQPVIENKAENRLLELIEREQLPGDVRSTLQGALTGDLARQQLLFQAMIDTWPRLSKNLSEIADDVKCASWAWKAFKLRSEEEASKEATARAEFMEDAWNETKPDIKRDELSSSKLIRDLCFGYYMGHHVVETYWQQKDIGTAPRAYKSVPPRFYGYPYYDQGDDRLMFDPSGQMTQNYEDFPDHHFLIGINKAHTGHPTVAAPLRALTGYWLAANFGLKWLLSFAQLYGVPFRWATYDDEGAKGKVCTMLKSIGSAGWGAFPKGTEIQFHDASKAANSLPQAGLIEMADEQCDIFILGQTLTSSVGDSGSRALGEVHENTRHKVTCKVAEFVADVINDQLVPSVFSINYGDQDLLPKFSPIFEQKEDPLKLVERDEKLQSMGVQFDKNWLYDRHNVPIPKDEASTFNPTNPNGVQGDPATGEKKTLPHETKEQVEARDASLTWKKFSSDSGTLSIPRVEMPQIYSGNRAALVNLLKKRGITTSKESIDADELLPTQLDYSPEKVQKSVDFVGGSRSILVSADNHVVDGHHQWLGALKKGEEISILRLGAPITRLLNLAHQMPSTTVSAMNVENPAEDQVKDVFDKMSDALENDKLLDWDALSDLLKSSIKS